jgi:hypothetical protein
MRRIALLIALTLPATAHAGGLSRPNVLSARGVGLGGAFSAIADDPTALHYNPAGLAAITGIDIMIGGELVIAPRTYRPIFADDSNISLGQPCIQDPPHLEHLRRPARVQGRHADQRHHHQDPQRGDRGGARPGLRGQRHPAGRRRAAHRHRAVRFRCSRPAE